MNPTRKALVSALAVSTLALAACGEAAYESKTGEDGAMPSEYDGAPAPEGANGSPPAGAESAVPGSIADGGNGDTPDGDRCGAGEVTKYVGQEATPDVRARITADVGHTRIRWVGPDTVVTMDYNPERLNVTLDADDVITGANCA